MIKHEWRKHEKELYMPKAKPELVEIPSMKFFSIKGRGNPNDEAFGEYIGVLYSLSYAVRMSHKAGTAPDAYFEYTVYPLEGVWDITDEAKANFTGVIDKNELVFNLMIRQPDFVDYQYAMDTIDRTKSKKPHPLLDEVSFASFDEGHCIQMMHVGPYDDEPESFSLMEAICSEQGVKRRSKIHREIYISDFRKTAPEKLKTVLRFQVDVL